MIPDHVITHEELLERYAQSKYNKCYDECTREEQDWIEVCIEENTDDMVYEEE